MNVSNQSTRHLDVLADQDRYHPALSFMVDCHIPITVQKMSASAPSFNYFKIDLDSIRLSLSTLMVSPILLIPSNPKVFWSYIKNLRRYSVTPPTIKCGSCEDMTPKTITNIFLKHFLSIYTQPLNNNPTYEERLNHIHLSSLVEVLMKFDGPFTGK